MAKFTPGIGVGSISGSVGGSTFSRNRFGPYIRIKANPVNPRTPRQTVVRNNFGGYSALWRTLSEGQRNAWAAAAETVANSNSLGFPNSISGQNLFVGFNVDQLQIGGGLTLTPPTIDDAPIFGAVALVVDTAPADLFTITAPLINGDTASVCSVAATAPFSAGINFVKPSAFRVIGSTTADNISGTEDLTTAYETVFGELDVSQAGSKVSVRITPYSPNGYRGVAVEGITIIL